MLDYATIRAMRVKSFVLALLVAACGDDASSPPDAGGPRDWESMEVPETTFPQAGVRRDLMRVDGFTPPPNPLDGAETPVEYNATQVLRYRSDPPVEPRAILVAMPGFLGGGASYDALARGLVLQGAADGFPVEVWAIDRRANLLEDLRGLDTAEAAQDPEIAHRWYFGVDTIDGEAFPGFPYAVDLPYMSEWGLETHVEDLRRVIALVPEAERRGHVFLVGHSLGASFAEAYAAWRFADGVRGVDELAGLVLIDGVLGETPISELEYHEGVGAGLAGMNGVDDIRDGEGYFELPLLGVSIYALVEVMSLRVLVAPDEVREDRERDDALRILLTYGGGDLPAFTNEAALGWGFDEESNGLSFAAVSAGHSAGGAVEEYENPFFGGTLIHPTDPTATYTWVDAAEDQPREATSLAGLAHSFVDGRTNFAEWYFPARLSLDLAAVAGASLAEDSWQALEGLRAFDGPLIDAPVLAVSAGAGLVPPEEYEPLRARLAPLAADRPFAGATRDDEAAFRVYTAEGHTHIDPLTADPDASPVPAEIAAFVALHCAAGTVTVP